VYQLIKLRTQYQRRIEKRIRHYLPEWEKTWPWLYFEKEKGLMYCKYCKEFPDIAQSKGPGKINTFLEECSHFRVESMKSHEKSEQHLNSTVYFKRRLEAPRDVEPGRSDSCGPRPIVN
jgi:hypothetical protein